MEIRRFDAEAQLFILHCLLEMQADTVIYENSIVSFEAILMRQCIFTEELSAFHEFIQVLDSVSVAETLKDNEFNSPDPSITVKQAPK
jgi:hypothetical protein